MSSMDMEELMPDLETAKVITDQDLIDIEIKELNRKIKEKGLPKELAIKLKQRRRTLKNRNYATSCREKKDAEITGLEGVREQEIEELKNLEEGNKKLREAVEKMKSNYEVILEFAHQNNLTSDMNYQLSPRQRDSD